MGLFERLHFHLQLLHLLSLMVELLLYRVDLLSLLGQPLIECQLCQQELILLSGLRLQLQSKGVSLLGQVVNEQGTVVRVCLLLSSYLA